MKALPRFEPLAGMLPALLLLATASSAWAGDRPRVDLPPAEPAPAPLTEPILPLAPALIPSLGGGIERVYFDEPGDGALWAKGRRWKMSFDGEGASYFASFGPHVPSMELRFAPEAVSLDGQPLPFLRSASVTRVGERVELARGTFVEAYELAPESVEQLFVFHDLPRRGELVLSVSAAGEYTPASRAEGLMFRSVVGDVGYSHAVAIDAQGRRVQASTTFEGGQIVIRVDADFVSRAELPLVIDPYIGQTWVDSSTVDTREPDVVWDSFNTCWLAVYHEVFSSTDNDVRVRVISSNGVLRQEGYIDFTNISWSRPRIAYVRADVRCLVVAEVGTVGARSVRGRTVKPNGTILEFGGQFTISGAHTGEKFAPTVGGDPSLSQPSYYCVAFQRERPNQVITHELHYALVNTSSQLVLGPAVIPAEGGFRDSEPSLSRSNGASRWTLAFSRWDNLTHGDIYGAYIARNGTLSPIFGVSAFGLPRDGVPCASSPLDDSSWSVIAFERRSSILAKPDVIVAAIHDGAVVDWANISLLEGSGTGALAQFAPSIDSDGRRLILAYSEFVPGFLYDQLYLSELFVTDGRIGIRQPHTEVFPLGLSQLATKVAAAAVNATGPNRFMIVHSVRQNDDDYDTSAVRFESTIGGSWSAYCFGDGTGTACPCGADGAGGHGCPNSVSGAGARLQVSSGLLSTVADSAVLTASSMPSGQFCVFFQGTSEMAGSPLGEGLLCAGGSIIRMAVKAIGAGGAVSFPAPGDPALSVAGSVPSEGGKRTYQVWYRDPSSSCGQGTNLTNGVRVLWTP